MQNDNTGSPSNPTSSGESVSKSGVPSPEVIAARLAALATVQPGDLIVFVPSAEHVYTCQVTGVTSVPDLIATAFEIRTYQGKFAGMSPAGYIHANNIAGCSELRILRATEGVL